MLPMAQGSDICIMLDGQGLYTLANGDVYAGAYHHNKKHGVGKYTSATTGEVFRGTWDTNKRHGHGECLAANGRVLKEGVWKDGVFCSRVAGPV